MTNIWNVLRFTWTNSTGVPDPRIIYRLEPTMIDAGFIYIYKTPNDSSRPRVWVCVCMFSTINRRVLLSDCEENGTSNYAAFARIIVVAECFFSFNRGSSTAWRGLAGNDSHRRTCKDNGSVFFSFLYFLFCVTGPRLLQSSSFIVINKWLLPLYGHIHTHSCAGKRYTRP